MKRSLYIPSIGATMAACGALISYGLSTSPLPLPADVSNNFTEEKAVLAEPHDIKVNHSSKRVSEEGQEYLLIGKSAFDEEGDNVFGAGGILMSHKVKVNFDDEAGKASISNILATGPYAELIGAANFSWDRETGVIKGNTPTSFSEASEAVCLVEFEGGALTLNGGEMYGAGYWRYFQELEMTVNSDRSVITPTTAYSVTENFYDDREGRFSATGLAAVMFDVNLYRCGEGPMIYTSESAIDFSRCYVGEQSSRRMLLVNPGTEDADYAISVSSGAYSVSDRYGVVPAGEYKEITVIYSPTEEGNSEAVLTVMTEQNSAKTTLSGEGQLKPDYTPIVKAGSEMISFNTSNDYPFLMTTEYGDTPTAVSSNKGVANSESWIDLAFEVPEGKRANLNVDAYFYPRYAAYDYFIISEGENTLYETEDDRQWYGEINPELSFIPGKHTVRIMYMKESQPNVPSVVMGEDYVSLRSLSLTLTDYLPQEARLSDNIVDFGKLYSTNEKLPTEDALTGVAVLKNFGYETLKITGITNSSHFKLAVDTDEIAPDGEATISVLFSGRKAGKYNEEAKIQTTAGDFKINLTADLRSAPDYASIIGEGNFLFQMGKYPLLVEDGEMINDPELLSCGEKTTCETTFVFIVPEGKVGRLTWDGEINSAANDEALIMIDANIFQMIRLSGQGDASCYKAKPTQCWVPAGEHMISFGFSSTGNSEAGETPAFSISNLSIEFFDEAPAVVIWERMPIEFHPVFPGYTDRRSVALYNIDFTKTRSVTVAHIDGDYGFGADYNTEEPQSINPLGSTNVTLTWTPKEVGELTSDIIISTDYGDVSVPVKGIGRDDSALIFYDGFEDGLDKWTVMDSNSDDNTWKEAPSSMAYIGEKALQHNTFFASGDSEDYIISPEITIPENGATLSYFRAYNSNNEAHEYRVLVGTGDDPSAFEEVYADEAFSRNFEEIVVSLDAYAGKTIRICFANTTPDGKNNILKIDDVAVLGYPIGSVGTVVFNGEKEWFDLTGQRVATPSKGIFIVREKNADGSVSVRKEILK